MTHKDLRNNRLRAWMLLVMVGTPALPGAEAVDAETPKPALLQAEALEAFSPRLDLQDLFKESDERPVDVPPDLPLRFASDVLLENILAQAQDLLASNQYYRAAEAYWRAARVAPDNESALSGMSACFLLAKDYTRALKAYEKLTRLYPSNEKYHLNLSAAYTGLEQHGAAAMELKKLLRLNPRHPEALYNLGINLILLGETGKAITVFTACRNHQPDNPLPLMALARLAGEKNDLNKMLRLLREAAALSSPREMKLWLADPGYDAWRTNEWFQTFLTSLENRGS